MQDSIDLEHLRALDGFAYLASPYSRYEDGMEAAFRDVCRAAGWLVKNGVNVFCPIAMTHPIAVNAGMDLADHDIWMPADLPFMRAASCLIVCMLPGWKESYGVQYEITEFVEQGKEVWYMAWNTSSHNGGRHD